MDSHVDPLCRPIAAPQRDRGACVRLGARTRLSGAGGTSDGMRTASGSVVGLAQGLRGRYTDAVSWGIDDRRFRFAELAWQGNLYYDRLRMLIGGQATGMNAAVRIRSEASRFLAVGEHIVDVDTLRLLTRPGEPRLTPKAAAVLLQLARSAGRTLSRDDLLNEVWKGTCPTPDVLTQAVKDLRRALGDDLHAPRFVETLPRLGYRLVASTRFLDSLDARSALASAGNDTTAVAPIATNRRRQMAVRAASAAFGLIVSGVVAMALHRQQAGTAELKPRWHVSDARSITADPGPENFPRISPDGTRIAYSVKDADRYNAHIVQRSLAQSRVMRLTEPTPGLESYPVWSPDGSTIAFARHVGDGCKILTAPALGGSERLVGACTAGALNYFSWTPDERHLVRTMPSAPDASDMAITLVPIDGGANERLAYAHGVADLDLDARYSPDGSQIAFRRGASPYSDLFVVSANGGPVRQVTHLASRMRGFDWTRDGSALVFSSGHEGPQALFAVSIEDGRIEALGVRPAEFPSAARASDTVVYEIPRLRTQLGTIDIGAAQPEQRDLVPSTGNDAAPTFSPVDDRIAFISDRSGAQQVWLNDPAANETFPLTESDEPTLRYPVWRPDGARLLITARGASIGRLIEIDIATRTRRLVSVGDEDVRYGVYGPKPGTYIAVVGGSSDGRELIEFENAKGKETSRHVLAHDVARFDYDPGDATVYFTKIGEPGLFKIDPQSSAEISVTQKINAVHLDGWMVHGGDIFYIEAQAIGPSNVHDLDPVSGEDRVIATIPGSIADFNFSLSHDLRRIVVVRIASDDTDVGAVTLHRDSAG
jgi:Tol biopolymer transport system component/DNA-binding winged helix-turn-helix (wHTH) protein